MSDRRYNHALAPEGDDKTLADRLLKKLKPLMPEIQPTPAQLAALCFAYRNVLQPDTPNSGIIVGDEQGCGKTLTALFTALIYWLAVDPTFPDREGKYRRPEGKHPVVIVVPKATLTAWSGDVDQLALPERFVGFIESGRNAKLDVHRVIAFRRCAIIITTSSALEADAFRNATDDNPRDPSTSLTRLNGHCAMVMVDEADKIASESVILKMEQPDYTHRIENGYKNELVALLELMDGCTRRVMLTGTPFCVVPQNIFHGFFSIGTLLGSLVSQGVQS
jgi:SNF2 family DNA or RNA helicase